MFIQLEMKVSSKLKKSSQNRPLESLCFDKIFGLILNVPSNYKLLGWVSLPLRQKHWLAIRKLDTDQEYYNLDSNLKSPEKIGSVIADIILIY